MRKFPIRKKMTSHKKLSNFEKWAKVHDQKKLMPFIMRKIKIMIKYQICNKL